MAQKTKEQLCLEVRRLRTGYDEDTETFGARLAVSGRTIENWEQGRRTPDRLAQRELEALARRLEAEHAQHIA